MVYVARGECHEAVRHCEAAIALIPEGLAQERFGQAAIQGSPVRDTLARALGALGRFAEAFGRLREAMHIAEEAGHVYTLVFPLFGLGTLKLDQGDFAGAVAPLERGLDLCRTREVPLLLHDFAWALGAAYHGTGRRAEGVALMEDAARGFAERTVRWCVVGRPRRGARRGVPPRRAAGGRHPDRPGRARGGSAAGGTRGGGPASCDCSATSRPIPTASRSRRRRLHYRQALALAEELGMRPLVAHCHLGLGKLYRRTGKREQAREHLTTATTMYREMDMRFYLEQAEAAMASDRPIVGQTDGP